MDFELILEFMFKIGLSILVGGLIGFDWSLSTSLVLGAACGAGMVWILAILFKAMYDLQTSGNVRMSDAVGHEGTVYANIPAAGEGRGQVKVVLKDRARIFSAMTEGDAVPTNATVRVTRVGADRTLVVAAV